MGLFTPFIYENKKGQKFWLHAKQRGKVTLYYFSRNPAGALKSLPKGFEVVENPHTGMPYLRKKKASGFLGIFGKKAKEEKKEES
ncbi:MAG: hypothetical protein DRP00_03435 [Candidatus Aenigmatarchaeota archaeon]|nr:MAG: hypothetical protein DRP00_03435 [Candidatus Aenigmarchaeota archaeon]